MVTLLVTDVAVALSYEDVIARIMQGFATSWNANLSRSVCRIVTLPAMSWGAEGRR